jgi:hypothetical protein
VLVPLQWGHQILSCFGFLTYPHTSHVCSPLVMWPKSNHITSFALDLKSTYEREHTIFGLLSLANLAQNDVLQLNYINIYKEYMLINNENKMVILIRSLHLIFSNLTLSAIERSIFFFKAKKKKYCLQTGNRFSPDLRMLTVHNTKWEKESFMASFFHYQWKL